MMTELTGNCNDSNGIILFSAFLFPIFLYLLYRFSIRNHDYWQKKGIPFVKPFPFTGVHPSALFIKRMEDVEIERYKQLGRIYGYYELNKPVISISDPELLKDILVKDFKYFPDRRIFSFGDPIVDKMLTQVHGKDWRKLRTIVSPAFSTGRIKNALKVFEDCAQTTVRNLEKAFMKRDFVDVLKIYGSYALNIIASSSFSTKLESIDDLDNKFAQKTLNALAIKLNFRFILYMLVPKLMQKLKIGFLDPNIIDFFKKISYDIRDERRKTGQRRNDFLQQMIDSEINGKITEEKCDEESGETVTNYAEVFNSNLLYKYSSNKHLSTDELVGQCLIFLIGASHTTTISLSIITYQLALNPAIQDNLFREIENTLKETEGKITYESVQRMKYLDNVISESLRIYPPVMRLDRTAEADYKLGDTGITIPKGMVVGIPIIAMHRDPEFFPEPEKFNPDRFSPEGREKHIPYTYLPFGVGPRNCVGMRFALLELKVCLIYVFSKFQVQTCSETKIPVEFGRAIGLIHPKSIKLKMELRKDCPLKFI